MKFLTGTVYSKALAIFLAASLFLLGAVAALTQLVIFREFKLTEEREMLAMLQRFSTVMARETRPFEAAMAEWARSDAMAGLLARATPDGTLGKITPATLGELGIDFVALYRDNGSHTLVTRNEHLAATLGGEDNLTRMLEQLEVFPVGPGNRGGYALLENRLVSLTAWPVESRGKHGTLVGGKIIGQDFWGFLEGLFSATIKFNLLGGGRGSEVANRDIVNLLNAQEVVIEAEESSQITGYRLIKALNGRPIGFVSISQPRPLRQQGLRAIQVFLTGICLAGGALVLVVWALLDRTILARIKDLTRKLDAEKRSGRLPVKLDFEGSDELAALARSIEDLAVLLQSTQFQYRAVVEDQTEMICRFDADARLAFANQVFLRMFELENRPVKGLPLAEVFPPDTARDFLARFHRLRPEEATLISTQRLVFPDENSLWVRSTLRKNFSPDGVCQGGQWVAADITSQIEAQRQMLETESRFRRLFETASDGILLVSWDKLVVSDINPSLCRMLMLAGSEVLNLSLNEIPVFSPCLDMVNYFRRAGTEGAHRPPFRNECRLERGDGSALYIELRCSGYEVADGRFLQLNFRNISERVLGERELRKLSAKLLRLQDEERRRIARELHDSTAQNLSALEMNLSLLEPLLRSAQPRALQLVAETRRIADECSRELRNISYLLHPPLIDEVGLAFAVKWFVDGFAKRTGIQATVEIEDAFPRLDPDIEMPLFRVVQEAMTNIYRHSGADHAWVTLHSEGRFVCLEIRDNGHGFQGEILIDEEGAEIPPTIRPGVGLAGMRERLANLGGKLDIENSPQGVTISIRLALSEIEEENPENF